jgi:hypothetical protein
MTMNDHATDTLLRQLFQRNAPLVDDSGLGERITHQLPRRMKRRRLARVAWALALACASVALVGTIAFGAYHAVTYFRSEQPTLVLSDLQVPTETVPPGGKAGVLSGLLPVAGTAVLQHVEAEGTTAQVDKVTQVRGRVLVYSLEMSKAGVSGILTMTSDLDLSADGSAAITGTWVIANDNGTWTCPAFTAYAAAGGEEQFGYGKALGAGAYEGLVLYLQWHSGPVTGSTAPSAKWTVIDGWVQRVD